jgi:hypothetical protein
MWFVNGAFASLAISLTSSWSFRSALLAMGEAGSTRDTTRKHREGCVIAWFLYLADCMIIPFLLYCFARV